MCDAAEAKMGWLGWLFGHRFKVTREEAQAAMTTAAREKGWAIGPLSIYESWPDYIGDATLIDVVPNEFNPQPLATFIVAGESGEVQAMRNDQLDTGFQ